MTKKFVLWLINMGIKIAIGILAVYLLVYASKYAFKAGYDLMAKAPASDEKVINVDIKIPSGASTETIANILKDKGLIGSTLYFRIKAKISGDDGMFQFGDYTLNTGMDEEDIMNILLTEGQKRETASFTIPEGYTVDQIADKLSDEDIVGRDEFLEAVYTADFGYEFISQIPERNIKLQGYLFPNTYQIYEDATAEDIVSTMLKEFDTKVKPEYYEHLKELNAKMGMDLTMDDIIIIASIIEREVKVDSERKTVAGVIYNRLEIEMNLEMCSTVIYALDEPRESISLTDLEVDSPYNTYRNAGLPYGPIANPGEASIIAALYPEEHDYLFFVLVDEELGQHEFNTSLDGHNSAKSKYKQVY